MKFSSAWAKTAAQNVTLKVATVVLAVTTISQMILIANLVLKDLPVIEKSCFSKALYTKPLVAGKDEIESFLTESLSMRFDSIAYVKDGFLSIEELSAREKEQAALKQKQINQKIIVSEIKNDGKEIIVLLDRLLSVGKVKSVLSLKIQVVLQKTNRSEANPYGLVLSSVSQIDEKEEK